MNKVHITWSRVEDGVTTIFEKLGGWKPDMIIAISRGGLIPAVMLSHILKVRDIHTLKIQSYTDTNDQFDIEMLPPYLDFDLIFNKKLLIIDDIQDSGRTINWVKSYLSQFSRKENHRYAVLVTKLEISEFGCYTAEHINSKDWVVFPWESYV